MGSHKKIFFHIEMYFYISEQGFPQHFAVKVAAQATYACRLNYVKKNDIRRVTLSCFVPFIPNRDQRQSPFSAERIWER